MKKTSNHWSFRAKEEVQPKLELAVKLGVNVSEIVNETIAKELDTAIQRRSRELRHVLEAVPARKVRTVAPTLTQ
jgi:hypothetical protein